MNYNVSKLKSDELELIQQLEDKLGNKYILIAYEKKLEGDTNLKEH